MAGKLTGNWKYWFARLLGGTWAHLPHHWAQGTWQEGSSEPRRASHVDTFCLYRWIPTCAQLFTSRKEYWVHFAPKSNYDSCRNIEEYFASVTSFMSLQLRELVIKSLEDLVSLFMIHKVCHGLALGPFEGYNLVTWLEPGFCRVCPQLWAGAQSEMPDLHPHQAVVSL